MLYLTPGLGSWLLRQKLLGCSRSWNCLFRLLHKQSWALLRKKRRWEHAQRQNKTRLQNVLIYASRSIVWDKWEGLHGLSKQVADQRD